MSMLTCTIISTNSASLKPASYLSSSFHRTGTFPDGIHSFGCAPDGIRHIAKVDHRGLIPITLGQFGRRSCIFDDGHLETLLQQLPHMGFNTQVCRHTSENDLAHVSFSQLQNKIVGFWPIDFVRTCNNG